MRKIIVKDKEENQKIEKYLRKYLGEIPLSTIYKLFRKKDIKVNGIRVDKDYMVQLNDEIIIYIKEEELVKKEPLAFIQLTKDFKVLYEDHNILAVFKPIGLLVQEDINESINTLNNQVLNYLYQKNEYQLDSLGFKPAPAHRIDRNTSGIVLFGKNMQALQALNDLFKKRVGIKKYYQSLVVGPTLANGRIEMPLIKEESSLSMRIAKKGENGLHAVTLYRVVKRFSRFTLLEVEIETGRTHQIRVHMNAIGHPLVGDNKYGDYEINREFKNLYKWENQFLHATKIEFFEIEGFLDYMNGKTIVSPLPEKSLKILELLK